MDDNKLKLDELISMEIEHVKSLYDSTSDEKQDTIDDLAKLYRLRIDEEKAIWDSSEKLDQNKADTDLRYEDLALKENQMKSEQLHKFIGYGLEAAGIIVPLIFYGVWMNKGFKFEESGTFTSTTFRGLFQKFKPTRK